MHNLNEFCQHANGEIEGMGGPSNIIPDVVGQVDSGLEQVVETAKELALQHGPYGVEALFEQGVGYLNDAITLRDQALSLEERVIAQHSQLFFRTQQLRSQREELQFRLSQPLSHTQLPLQRTLRQSPAGQISATSASEEEAKQFSDTVLQQQLLRVESQLKELELLQAKSQVAGSASNYVERLQLAKGHYQRELTSALRYLYAAQSGLQVVYDHASPLPDHEEEHFIDELYLWAKECALFLSQQQERRYVTKVVLPLNHALSLPESAPEGHTLVSNFTQQRNDREITVNLGDEALSFLHNPQVVGVSLVCEDHHNKEWPEGLNCLIVPPPQLNGAGEAVVKSGESVFATAAPQLPALNNDMAGASFSQYCPKGEWRIKLPAKSHRNNAISAIEWLYLVIAVSSEREGS